MSALTLYVFMFLQASQLLEKVSRAQSAVCDSVTANEKITASYRSQAKQPVVIICGDLNTTPDSSTCQVSKSADHIKESDCHRYNCLQIPWNTIESARLDAVDERTLFTFQELLGDLPKQHESGRQEFPSNILHLEVPV